MRTPGPQPDTPVPHVRHHCHDDLLWVIVLSGDIEDAVVALVEEATLRAERATAHLLVYDLDAMGFCDSSLLNHLLRTARRRHVVLAGTNPFMDRLLDVTGVGHVFTRVATLDAARSLTTDERVVDDRQ
ncbi:STAS domain-containing protein [Streptomyces sp. NPDC048111]|uniref:STAS domain-containing protein n=1 Tax=Streptomyces sp. NPDC048111 TaxID=3365500 RepID=UPI00371902C1